MTPEQIRRVFTEHFDDTERVKRAIYQALDQLEWVEGCDAKAKSPYALTRLTAGLSQADAIIAMAAEMVSAFKTRMHTKDPEIVSLIQGSMAIHSINPPGERKGIERWIDRIINEMGEGPTEARAKTLILRLQTLVNGQSVRRRRRPRRRTLRGQIVP